MNQEIIVAGYASQEYYDQAHGINNEPDNSSYDHPTDYDGDRQAQQDFAQDSRQENDRYEYEAQQRDKQSSYGESVSTSTTNSNQKNSSSESNDQGATANNESEINPDKGPIAETKNQDIMGNAEPEVTPNNGSAAETKNQGSMGNNEPEIIPDNGSKTKKNNNETNQKSNQDSEYTWYGDEWIDDTLDEQSRKPSLNKKYTDGVIPQKQEVKDDEGLGVDIGPHVSLKKYTENRNKRIVADQEENTVIANARKEAIIFVANNPQYSRRVEHVVHPTVCTALEARGINPGQFNSCVGNEVQQQIHAEFVSILNDTINIPSNESTQPLLDVMVTCAHAGNVYSQQNNADKAFSLADCAWAALDCANAVCASGINLTQKTLTDIANGMVKGCIHAVKNNVNIVLDPIGTATNIAETFVHLGYCFGKLMEPIMYFDGDLAHNEIDWDVAAAMNEEWVENVQGVIDAASQVTLEGATAFATELYYHLK